MAKQKVDPKAYMEQLKRELPPSDYEAIRQALKGFRGSKDSTALIDVVVDLLKRPGRHHLLSGFSIFLTKESSSHLRKCIRWESCVIQHLTLLKLNLVSIQKSLEGIQTEE